MKNKKEKFIVTLIMFAMFGLLSEIVFTAIGGNLSGVRDWHGLTLMGHVSIWMSFVYITAFPTLNKLNDIEWFWHKPMLFQTIIGGFVIGIFEFVWGLILIKLFGLNCWNYILEPFNIMGLVCLRNYIFFTLSYPLAIFIIDNVQWYIYREEEKEDVLHYNILENYKKLITFK